MHDAEPQSESHVSDHVRRGNRAIVRSAGFFTVLYLLFVVLDWTFFVIVFWPLPLGLALWWLWRVARPANHPLLRRLSRYGPLPEVVASLEAAIAATPAGHVDTMPRGSDGQDCWVWDGWVIGFGIGHAMPVEAITWAYKKVTTYVMFPIAFAWETEVVLWDRTRRKTELPLRTYKVEPFFAQLSRHNPAIRFGFYE